MKTQVHHPLTITYTLMVPQEVIDYITDSDGTNYWALRSGDFVFQKDTNEELFLTDGDGTRYYYDTANCLRGIELWIRNGGDFSQLLDMDTDHTDHDQIWQYGFFNEIVYG